MAASFVYYHKYHKAVILFIVKILDIVIPLVKWNSNVFFNHLSPFVYTRRVKYIKRRQSSYSLTVKIINVATKVLSNDF